MVQLAHDAALYADAAFLAEGGDPAPSRMVHEQIARLRRHAPGFTGAPLGSGGEGLY